MFFEQVPCLKVHVRRVELGKATSWERRWTQTVGAFSHPGQQAATEGSRVREHLNWRPRCL